MPRLKPRAAPEPEIDAIEAAMCAGAPPPPPPISDEEGVRALSDPAGPLYAPSGFWWWIMKQPNGRALYDDWQARYKTALDESRATDGLLWQEHCAVVERSNAKYSARQGDRTNGQTTETI